MGAVIPLITPMLTKVATNFLVSTVTNSIFGNSGKSSANSGAFSANSAMAGVQEASAILVNKNSNNASLPIVYGRRRLGGTRVYVETSDGSGDTGGTAHLNMVIAISDGANLVGLPRRVWFDDELIWDVDSEGTMASGAVPNDEAQYVQLRNFEGQGETSIEGKEVIINWHVGSAGETDPVDPYLQTSVGSSEWTNNHHLWGVNYAVVLLEANPDYYEGTVPQITFEFDGARLVAVNQDLIDNPTHEYYSDFDNALITGQYGANPVDVLYDYLSNPFYGKGLDFNNDPVSPGTGGFQPGQDIDLESFAAARAYCEELVDRGNGNVPRYSFNGVVHTSANLYENINMIVNSFNGMLIYINGKYVLKIRKPNETSIMSFDRDNILGDMEVNLSGASQRINRVSVSYANTETDYNDDIFIVFDETAFIEDNSIILETKVDMPLITDTTLIEQLAQYKIDTSRQSTSVSFTAPHTAMTVECGDIIDVTHDMFDWDSKLFRVLSMEILADNTVNIIANEYKSENEI